MKKGRRKKREETRLQACTREAIRARSGSDADLARSEAERARSETEIARRAAARARVESETPVAASSVRVVVRVSSASDLAP